MNWVHTEGFEFYWVQSAHMQLLSTVLELPVEHSLNAVLLKTTSVLYSTSAVAAGALSACVRRYFWHLQQLGLYPAFLVLTDYLT